MKKKKGFTLIELIAVLVILAILALIVTPLVMSIIKKARVSADKRSIDAYGRSVELAIATYLLDNGDFPSNISQLTIEYSGEEVVCSTAQINSDSSVYLAGCTVGGRSVDYTYGSDKSPTYDAYEVGDQVTYNNIDYYVIKDSGVKESTVTLLKATPLTVAEVNLYGGVGTANNHVNMNVAPTKSYYQTAYDQNGYGGMQYYSSQTCTSTYPGDSSGCTTDYAQSEIKHVVDGWKQEQAPQAIEARLITYDELIENLGYDPTISSVGNPTVNENVPTWVYNSNYYYYTASNYRDTMIRVWSVAGSDSYLNNHYGNLGGDQVSDSRGVVRPIIVLSKANISS